MVREGERERERGECMLEGEGNVHVVQLTYLLMFHLHPPKRQMWLTLNLCDTFHVEVCFRRFSVSRLEPKNQTLFFHCFCSDRNHVIN